MRWRTGSPAGSPAAAPKTRRAPTSGFFGGKGYATWQIWWNEGTGPEKKIPIDWGAIGTPTAFDPHTFGNQWNHSLTANAGGRVTLPEYFRLENGGNAKEAKWAPVSPYQVPPETGLREIRWARPAEATPEPYATPDGPATSWKRPGPAAGPFRARLGDGSVVTYYWYRFAEQPALLNADLTTEERERLQARVEKLHRARPKNRNYLPPPATVRLASLDPAQIVKPPKGLEAGYVPVATRQEMARP